MTVIGNNHRPTRTFQTNMSKDERKQIDPEKANALKEVMQDIHPHLKLCGEPKNALFQFSEDLLTYIWSILRHDSPKLPGASIEQWSDLLSDIAPHMIIPLLYWRIGSLPKASRPPEPIIDQMRMAFLASRVRSMHMERQLGDILNAFENKGVGALVLRGPALAWSIYPDPALRPSSDDLDLLVLPEQMVRARKILEGLGYKCMSQRFEATRDFFREEVFIHQGNPRNHLPIDLHWVPWEWHTLLGSNGEVGVEDLFHRASKVRASTLTFETLHPIDALIHGAIHLAMIHHRDKRLIWIYDIALLACHLSVPEDWEALQERCVAWRARRAAENTLKMAQALTGLRLPDGFKDFSGWPRPMEDELAMWRHATTGDHWVAALLKRYLSSPGGFLKMSRSFFRLLFPPPDVVRYCYPPSRDWLLPLSYGRRWHRWFRELILKRINASKQRA